MVNDKNFSEVLTFDDFIVKCRMMDEACRQWCCFIDEIPERRNGGLFTEFYAEICEQKYQEYLDDPDYRDDCDDYAALSVEEKRNLIIRIDNQNKEEKTMSNNKTISASDPQAVEKLTEKLQKCEELQIVMKGVNAYWRKTGTCMGAPGIAKVQAAKLDEKVRNATVSWERQPFSSYDLTNNNSEIKRLKSRIAVINRHQEVGFSGWKFKGGHAEANTDLNRLQLIFDERPNAEKHQALRHAGFVYSHTNGAYQRQLNDNAIYAAGRLDFVKPSDGCTVWEYQPGCIGEQDAKRPTSPKIAVKDTGSR